MVDSADCETSSVKSEPSIITVQDCFNFLIYCDLPLDRWKMLEDITSIVKQSGKFKDIEKRIKLKNTQSIDTYHELAIGKLLVGFAKRKDYKLDYEKQIPQYGNMTPDWTISLDSDTVIIEVATKHNSKTSLIKQAFVKLIADRLKNVIINDTHFALPYFDKEKINLNDLQIYYEDLIKRIEKGIAEKPSEAYKAINIDGLHITLNSTQTSCRSKGSTPSRYLLSIAEKAEKYKQLSREYPMIIAIVSKSLTRGGTIEPKMMADLLFGPIGKYHPKQFDICECDHQNLKVMQPSISKLAGILFYDMQTYNDVPISYTYCPNPLYNSDSKIYHELQTFFNGKGYESKIKVWRLPLKDKKKLLEAMDNHFRTYLRARSLTPYIDPTIIDSLSSGKARNCFCVTTAPLYQGLGYACHIVFEVGQFNTDEKYKQYQDVGHWINQSFMIELKCILDTYIDWNQCPLKEDNHFKLLELCRNLFAHTSYQLDYKAKDQKNQERNQEAIAVYKSFCGDLVQPESGLNLSVTDFVIKFYDELVGLINEKL